MIFENDLGRWKNWSFLLLIFIPQCISKELPIRISEKLFPKSKVTMHCSLHSVANWFGIWGKRSHWPCAMESLLLWGKSWVRLFIHMTFTLFLFSCLAHHMARNEISLLQWLLSHHNFELKVSQKIKSW